MFKKLTLATVVIMIGVTKSATWQSSGPIFCNEDCENYKGESTQWNLQYVYGDQNCDSDDSTGDTYGNTCSSFYDFYTNNCREVYITNEFNPLTQCCGCGGGTIRPSCSSSNQCDVGQGNCTSDSDCLDGLKCGFRDNFEQLPGLQDLSQPIQGDLNGTNDYCYDPNYQIYSYLPDSGTWQGYTQDDMNTTSQKEQGYISRIKICSNDEDYWLIEYDMSNICDEDVNTQSRRQLRKKKGSSSIESEDNPLQDSPLYLGYPNADYNSTECDEVILSDGDCITDLTTFHYNTGPVALGYNTTLGKSGVFGLYSAYKMWHTTWSEYESFWLSYDYPLGSSTERASSDTQVCLVSIKISEDAAGQIWNVEFYYNAELPYTDSQFCEDYRKGTMIAVVILVIGLLCCCMGALGGWYYCYKRKQSSGSGDNDDASSHNTPEKLVEETSTVIQQPVQMATIMQPVMVQQPQPMMVQQPAPMMMQQPQPVMMQQQMPPGQVIQQQ